MYVRDTKGEAEVDQCGVNHDAFFGEIQQVRKIAEMTKATANSVSSAILVQQKYLARAKPTLKSVSNYATASVSVICTNAFACTANCTLHYARVREECAA